MRYSTVIKTMQAFQPEILLLNPPFGTMSNPYISIPVLAGYLQQQKISVAAYDIKREFYMKLLAPQNILKGLQYAQERFLELNQKPALKFSEIFEYRMVLAILTEMKRFKREVQKLLLPFADFSDIQNSRAIHFFLRTATFPYFPEMIIPDFMFSIGSRYEPLSSSDILQASADETYYTRLFEDIIAERLVRTYAPRIIGLSVVFTTQIIPAFQCARILKKYFPQAHITLGGPSISSYFRTIREKRLLTIVDSLVLDEGEIPLQTLAQELSKDTPELRNVPGLIYLAGQEIQSNPPAPTLDMEQSPPPDYTIFPLDNYLFTKNELTVPFRLSKGCSWRKCTFCRTDLALCRDYQQPSKELMYDQLVQVINTSGLSSFFFSDENADPEILEYIAQRLIADRLKIRWFTHTRVSPLLTKARCELYRQSGCLAIALGIESFSDRILKLMKKGITVKLIDQVLRGIDKALPLSAYMIIGFPTETEEEALMGYQHLTGLISEGLLGRYFYNLLEIIYGSDIWNNPQKYGVSALHLSEGADLSPNILHFDCPGLSRQQAYQLAMRFNLQFSVPRQMNELREIQLQTDVVPLRYDVKRIGAITEAHSFSPLPLCRWLDMLDQQGEKLYPTTP